MRFLKAAPTSPSEKMRFKKSLKEDFYSKKITIMQNALLVHFW